MSAPFWDFAAMLAAGAAIGVATLPWASRAEPGWAWVLVCACFWPLLLPHFAWAGAQAYYRAWLRYLDRSRAATYHKRNP